jgi:hypothetical protein
MNGSETFWMYLLNYVVGRFDRFMNSETALGLCYNVTYTLLMSISEESAALGQETNKPITNIHIYTSNEIV